MYQEIEAPLSEIIIMSYELVVFDKNNSNIILKRIFQDENLAIEYYEKQLKIYHNIPKRVIIKLYDLNKCTNIKYYDTDDNI